MLLECVYSILNQTYQDFEILIVDDGSSDDTEEKVSGLNPKINFYKLQHSGNPSILRNYGIEHSKGQYIAFCDDDDIWHPKKLEIQLKFLDEYDFICTNADFIDSSGKQMDFIYYSEFETNIPLKIEYLFVRNYIITSSVLLKREILPNGYFNILRTKSMAEDYDLWLKLALNNSIYFLKDCLIKYRIHTEPHHKGENYSTLLENTIELINKYKLYLPKSSRKYANWGIFKFRKKYLSISIRKFKIDIVLAELFKMIISICNPGFLILFLNRLIYGQGFVIRSLNRKN